MQQQQADDAQKTSHRQREAGEDREQQRCFTSVLSQERQSIHGPRASHATAAQATHACLRRCRCQPAKHTTTHTLRPPSSVPQQYGCLPVHAELGPTECTSETRAMRNRA
eukprot:3489002-Rhodomonas_salina.2